MINNMDNWQHTLVSPDISVNRAIERINQGGLGVLLVVDVDRHLLGVITDGDIRRHFLKKASLNDPVSCVMNPYPQKAIDRDTKDQWLKKMLNSNISHLPIVNSDNEVVGLETLNHLAAKPKYSNWVVFMAGGLGTRLHPLTLESPKPLIKIWHKPILEILLENFIDNGFTHFYFSVNYMATMIKEYFGNGEKWGVTIRYIQEDKMLGTAGSLRLLPTKPIEPFFVINADIMTNLNFRHILEFHRHHAKSPMATVCVRQYENTLPYGVVNIDPHNHCLLGIEEKPTRTYFVNAGIYILDPSVLQFIPMKNCVYDMPYLLSELVKNEKIVSTFPIREYWLDVGTHENLTQAVADYEKFFV